MTTTDNGVAARHSSATAEHYTPAAITLAARSTLGAIDLDPFSCAFANRTVHAGRFYSIAAGEDGFSLPWEGRVFCNPPGGVCDKLGRRVVNASKGAPSCRETGACGLPVGHVHEDPDSSQKRAWFRLAAECKAQRVTSAIFVCFSLELLQTTQTRTPAGLPLPLQFPICYPSKRVAYVREDGTVGASPPHSSCLIFIPPTLGRDEALDRFRRSFAPLGHVVTPWEPK